VSFLTHVAAFALAIAAVAYGPQAAQNSTPYLPSLESVKFVWLPAPGPGGGGGGGGNMSKEPPRKLEVPGKDKAAIPAVQPKAIAPVETPKDDPPMSQELVLPVKTMALGNEVLPGALVGATGTNSQGSGQGGGAGTGSGGGIGPGRGLGLGDGTGGGTGGGAYRPGGGVTPPRVLREFKPNYTGDAMRAKVQGSVWLEAIVLPDGTVGSVEVIKSLDPVFGLDQEAIKAAKKWQFVPGTKAGQPVPVIVTIELTFTLR
jgi:TonB family protein